MLAGSSSALSSFPCSTSSLSIFASTPKPSTNPFVIRLALSQTFYLAIAQLCWIVDCSSMLAIKPGPIITIDGDEYHIQGTRVCLPAELTAKLDQIYHEPFIPVTAISWDKSQFNNDNLLKTYSRYTHEDDVWDLNFAAFNLLLRRQKNICKVQCKRTVCLNNIDGRLPAGPLVVEKANGHVYRVSKLVNDTNAAFISAIIPGTKPHGTFHEFPEKASGSDNSPCSGPIVRKTIKIALPSRLYFETSNARPLAGLRVGVKDSIAMKGLRTGFGSQAWLETYGPEKSTAPCIQRLIDAGAIIVGKVVSSELAEGVEPREWTQGTCPYNPRGDGQQKPSSSSTGSAVAAAAYDWLDITIGTDTGGSIRHPAGVNGLFGQRPTSGSIDLKGVLGATDLFNTVGIFARSAELFTKVGAFMIGSAPKVSINPQRRRYNLLYPTRSPPSSKRHHGSQHRWFPHPEADMSTWTEAEIMIEKVIVQMEAEFDCERIPFNIYDVWGATPPKGQPRSLDAATGKIYGDITTSSACATGVDQFVADYKAAHGGKEPEMGEIVKRRMDYGRHLASDRIAAALEATAAFKTWMETALFGSYDQDATTLMIFPQSCGTPDYRDGKSRWDGNLFIEVFSIYAFGYLCGCPDYTIPIGEVPYDSAATGKTEYLPVSLSLVGKPGTDQELFDVVDHLHKKRVVRDVMAGSRLYPDQTTESHVFESVA